MKKLWIGIILLGLLSGAVLLAAFSLHKADTPPANPVSDTVMQVVGSRLQVDADGSPLYNGASSTRMATSGDGGTVALMETGNTNQVVLLDALTGAVQSTITLGSQPVYAMALDHSGSTLALSRSAGGASAGSLQVFNRAGQMMASLDNAGLSVAISPDGQTVAYGDTGANPALRVVSVGNGQDLARADFGGSILRGVTFSPDGSQVAFVDGDSTVRMMAVNDGRGLVTGLQDANFQFHAALNAMAFSPTGQNLVVGGSLGNNSALVVLDGQNLQRDAIIRIPNEQLTSLAFSPDGSRMLTFGSLTDDLTATRMRIWDAATRTVIATNTGVRNQSQMSFIGGDATRIGVMQFQGALQGFSVAIGQ